MSNDLSFTDYQLATAETAIYPGAGEGGLNAVIYTTLGLAGEAAEIANKVKKIMRDDDGVITEEKESQIADEISDVLWYASQLASELGFSLEKIAQANLDKLADRKARGVLTGSGDNR